MTGLQKFFYIAKTLIGWGENISAQLTTEAAPAVPKAEPPEPPAVCLDCGIALYLATPSLVPFLCARCWAMAKKISFEQSENQRRMTAQRISQGGPIV